MARMFPVRHLFVFSSGASAARRGRSTRRAHALLAAALCIFARAPFAAEPLGNAAVLDFVEVLNQVKAQYAEPVDDHKLVTERRAGGLEWS